LRIAAVKKLLIMLLVVAVGLVAGVYFYERQTSAAPPLPPTGTVGQGKIQEKVSSTAKVQPVDVTYVSSDVPYARISEIVAGSEIGKEVKKGAELLKLDDQLALARVDEAESAVAAAEASKLQAQAKLKSAQAGLGQAKAKLTYAQSEQKSVLQNTDLTSQSLKEKAAQLVAEADEGVNYADSVVKEAESAIKAAEANIKKANAGLSGARENLKTLVVTSPIDGTIIDRRVTNTGQVISPQTHPVLFVIVPDINKFELEAQVGEADIAKVSKGMKATFKVDAYAEDNTTFDGEVTHIAFVPTVSASRFTDSATSGPGPVLYKVTLRVLPYSGPQARPLKPGLTANVELIAREVPGALHVPNQALGYRPLTLSKEDDQLIKEREKTGWKPLWTLTNGQSQLLFVQTGANDGGSTEILKVHEGGKLEKDMEVITDNPPQPKSGGLFGGKEIKIL
jgi:HlyD family secretion protein